MEDLLRLAGLIEESQKHLKRLELASNKMSYFMPLSGERFEKLTEDEIEHIDQFLYRFAKLQDTYKGTSSANDTYMPNQVIATQIHHTYIGVGKGEDISIVELIKKKLILKTRLLITSSFVMV